MLRFFIELVLLILLVFSIFTSYVHAQVPAAALHYRPDLVRASQAVWGLRAPVPVFASQINQESGWRPDVCSPYACGLTQFTPDTAEWIARTYRVELFTPDAKQARFDPRWAIMALVRYDKHLFDRTAGHSDCDKIWGTLRQYNGGPGHWFKEASLSTDPLDRAAVDAQCGKAKRSVKFCPESLGYPKRVLNVIQPRYQSWGTTMCQ